MRLAKLELSGVGPFEGAVFEIPEPKGPGELVLFEGPNGSGKTTIVQSIAAALAGAWQPDKLTGASDHAFASTRFEDAPGAQLKARFRDLSASVSVSITEGALSARARLNGRSVGWSDGDHGAVSAALAALTSASQSVEQALSWAAFAYSPHQPTAVVATAGPRDIDTGPLAGALSFGTYGPASGLFGQLLINLEFERMKSALYAHEAPSSKERDEMVRIAEARRASLARFESVLSYVLDRQVKIHFPFGKNAPEVTLDGDEVPFEALGEGIRSTIAWLTDLLVRLERITWTDVTRSPLEQDFWLILDEIDQSLHPTLQARILPAVRKLFPNARIYATTHSPFVVASAAEGTIFAIRPGRDHRVRGKVDPRALEPGQSLEFVVTEIFEAQAGFVDPKTRTQLAAHRDDIHLMQRKKTVDWGAFLKRRAELMELNDEVRTAVAMQEVPVRAVIDAQLRALPEGPRDSDHA